MLKVNEYGGRQAKGNEKKQCLKGWETLVNYNFLQSIHYGNVPFLNPDAPPVCGKC